MRQNFISQPSLLNLSLKVALITSLTALSASLVSRASDSNYAAQSQSKVTSNHPAPSYTKQSCEQALKDGKATPPCETRAKPEALSFITMTIPGSVSGNLTNTKYPSGASNCDNGRCKIQFDSGTFAENIARKDTLLISTK